MSRSGSKDSKKSRASSNESIQFQSGEVSTLHHVRARRPVKYDSRAASPYSIWLNDTRDYDPRQRHVFFQTIGRAPVDRPVRPARLTPVRDLATPELDENARGDQNETVEGSGMSHSFSQSCCQVIQDQNKIQTIDALIAFKSCSFFEACSQGFIQDLVWASGAPAWQGILVPSGDYVFKSNDLGQSLFVISRGIAEIIISEWETEEIGVFGYFGDMQVLGVLNRRQETVRAKTSLHLFEVKAGVLTAMLKRSRKDELLSCGSTINDNDAHLNLLEKSTDVKIGQAFYPDERRHFESEAVRMYKEMFVGAQSRASARSPRTCASSRQSAFDAARTSMRRRTISQALAQQVSPRRSVSPMAADNIESRFTDFFHDVETSRLHEHDSFMNRIVGSLRADVKHGFMMPANSELVPNWERQLGGTRAASRITDSQSPASLRVSPQLSQAEHSLVSTPVDADDDDEEDNPSECSDPLDLELLPPIAALGTVQKHSLYRKLKVQLMKIKRVTRSNAASRKSSCWGSRMGSRMGSKIASQVLPLWSQESQFDSFSIVSSPCHETGAQTPRSVRSRGAAD